MNNSYIKDANLLASDLGLAVYRHNPGDGSKYKVGKPGACFHSVSGGITPLTFLSAKEVLAYLRGIQDGQYHVHVAR